MTIAVSRAAEIKRAVDSARSFAGEIGFAEKDREEICLVVTELASNLVKHATGGRLKFECTDERAGMQIESEDTGPGIPDVEKAIADGYSTSGSLGIGLGAVNRLMDELEFYSESPTGVRIVCQRWLRSPHAAIFSPRLEFGAATRSFHRQPENGDAFVIRQWDGYALAGVIDGLGHGQFARRASQTARQYIDQHFDQSLDNLFRGVGRVCRVTRGVVMALVRFDFQREKLTVASIGDIETRLIGNSAKFNYIVRRGVVGYNAPNPVCSDYPWTRESLLIMHSDGIQTHWDWEQFGHLKREAPGIVAQRLLAALGKNEDDATVLVAKNAAS